MNDRMNKWIKHLDVINNIHSRDQAKCKQTNDLLLTEKKEALKK